MSDNRFINVENILSLLALIKLYLNTWQKFQTKLLGEKARKKMGERKRKKEIHVLDI